MVSTADDDLAARQRLVKVLCLANKQYEVVMCGFIGWLLQRSNFMTPQIPDGTDSLWKNDWRFSHGNYNIPWRSGSQQYLILRS